MIKLQGDDLGEQALRQVVARIQEPGFWEDARLWHEIQDSLPAYRLSKFQPLMPPTVEREWVAGYLLDVPGTRQWLSSLSVRTP